MDTCVCTMDSLCSTGETNNFVKQLYSNKDFSKKKKWKSYGDWGKGILISWERV